MTDAWAMQKKLMEISSQQLPVSPEFNNTSVLYSALILEEVSELLESLTKIITPDMKTKHPAFYEMLVSILSAKEQNHRASVHIRKLLVDMEDFSYPLGVSDAVAIADDSTDIAVVNAGFILASGIDGSKCYDEVASSNLSKANPDTGIIDKDSSGKWKKGVNFFKPDLHKVIYK